MQFVKFTIDGPKKLSLRIFINTTLYLFKSTSIEIDKKTTMLKYIVISNKIRQRKKGQLQYYWLTVTMTLFWFFQIIYLFSKFKFR